MSIATLENNHHTSSVYHPRKSPENFDYKLNTSVDLVPADSSLIIQDCCNGTYD